MQPLDHLTFVSYAGGAALNFCVFIVGLILAIRRQLHPSFLIASLASTAWCMIYAGSAVYFPLTPMDVLMTESIRYGVWLYCLLRTIRFHSGKQVPRKIYFALMMIWAFVFLSGYLSISAQQEQAFWLDNMSLAWNSLLMAILCIVGVEQLFRNAPHARMAKVLSVGVGAIMAFDLYLFAQTLIMQGTAIELWNARGLVGGTSAMILAVGLLATASQGEMHARVSISRPIVFYTTSLTTAGFFLALMAAGGYYIKHYGGDWGTILQIVLIFTALMLVAIVFVSESVRTRLSVIVDKHFFHHKYDYRVEWLKLINYLSEPTDEDLDKRALRAVTGMFRSPGGCLWVDNHYGKFIPVAAINMDIPSIMLEEPDNSEFSRILSEHDWVFVPSASENDELSNYNDTLPSWVKQIQKLWLIMPLKIEQRLYGFILLASPGHVERLSWEDLDLLKTVGRQVASYLSRHEAAELLAQSKQFEAYNKLTAFIMHDLKNLIAQQALVVENANKHKENPAFIEDAINTIDNSVKRMSNLLKKLQQKQPSSSITFDIKKILIEAVKKCQSKNPRPSLRLNDGSMMVTTDQDHLEMIFTHIIKNAQEATDPGGFVDVTLYEKNDNAVIEVEDNGEGMDADFIKNRLFRPFDTTKSGKGMGIGVYQTREFIRSLGGDVSVHSTPKVGTVFKITIPLATDSGYAMVQTSNE